MRIAGITLPDHKRIEIALTAIHGIGRSLAHAVLTEAKVDFGVKTADLTDDQQDAIRKIVEQHQIEGELKRGKASHIKRLIDITCYRGIRHTKRLPVHGQTTKTNSRTGRGNKRATMGSGRVKVSKT